MIYPNFYRKENLEKSYFGGKAFHFPLRQRFVIVGQYRYTLREGEDLLLLAQKVFGAGYSYFWTIIAEINPTKSPDEWHAGEIVLLPKIVVANSRRKLETFSDAKITSTTV